MNSTRIRNASALKDYLKLVAALPRRGPAEREALAVRSAAGDASAAVALMESFLPLVVAEAALHRGLGLPFEPLIAAGNRTLAVSLRDGSAPSEARLRRAVRRGLHEILARRAVRGPEGPA